MAQFSCEKDKSLAQGTVALLAIVVIYVGALLAGHADSETRAPAFAAISCCNIALIFVDRSRTLTLLGSLARPNRALWWMSGAALAVLAKDKG